MIDLSTAKEIFIEGKEVKNITTMTGELIWGKPSISVASLVLSSDKSILSAYDEESAVLSCTAYDNSGGVVGGVLVSFDIIDSDGGIVENIGSDVTNVDGVCSVVYDGKGAGDLYIQCNYQSIIFSETYSLSDNIYARLQQYDFINDDEILVTLINNDIISDLPNTYSIEFEIKTTNPALYNREQRLLWTPVSEWTGTGNQPKYAMFVGYNIDGLQGGVRRNRTEFSSKSITIGEWGKIRIEKQNDTQFYIYHNDSYFTWWTLSSANNYNEWMLGLILWSKTTFSIKNIKIIPL